MNEAIFIHSLNADLRHLYFDCFFVCLCVVRKYTELISYHIIVFTVADEIERTLSNMFLFETLITVFSLSLSVNQIFYRGKWLALVEFTVDKIVYAFFDTLEVKNSKIDDLFSSSENHLSTYKMTVCR